MSTSTITLANRQNSYFANWGSPNIQVKKPTVFGFLKQHNTLITGNKQPFSDVVHFFDSTEIVNSVTHDIIPAGNLYYKDSLVLKFSLSEKYAAYFPLLRGLFGFGKFSGLTISTDKESKTFQIVLASGFTKNAARYFEELFLELVREIKFKLALRDVLYVQYEAERIQTVKRQNLYNSFH